MNNTKFSLRTPEALLLPAADADTLLRLSDGDCALLYLYLLRAGGVPDEKAAAEALRMSVERLRLAADRLRKEGLLGESAPALEPADETQEYTAEELLARSREDRNWSALLQETERIMGKHLSRQEMNTLYDIYQRLGMSTETIIFLINYLLERYRKRYGEGRVPTLYAIQKEAFAWARLEVLTLDDAEAYVAKLERSREKEQSILDIIQLRDRKPSPSERQYLESWAAMNLGDEVYALAYDRMVSQIGKFNWKYMNSILLAWQEKGLKTVAEIEKGDVRGGRAAAHKPRSDSPESPWTGDDLSSFMEMVNRKG